MKRTLFLAMLLMAGMALAAGPFGSGGSVFTSNDGAYRICVTVAASDAPSVVKSSADYVCDGTDDQEQIQAALDSLPDGANTGGLVQLSAGTFTINSEIKMKGWQALQGCGIRITCLVASAAWKGNIIQMLATEYKTYFGYIGYLEIYGNKDGSGPGVIANYSTGTATFTNGSATVTGNGTTWTSAMVGRLIINNSDPVLPGMPYKITGRTSDTEVTIETVYAGTTASTVNYLIVPTGHGIYTNGGGINVGSVFTTNDVHIEHIMVTQCYQDGIRCMNSWGYKLTNLISETNNGTGVHLAGGQGVLNNSFIAYNKGNQGVLLGSNSSSCVVNNCTILQNLGHGILDSGDKNIINGNIIQENSYTTVNTSSGIFVDVSASYGTITGNVINGGGTKQKYGIVFTGSDFQISGNNIYGNVTAAINNDIYGPTYGVRSNINNNRTDGFYFESKYVAYKNTSAGQLVQGDVVILKAVAAGNECTTTTTAGDKMVVGMVDATIENNASGMVLVLGKTTYLKVDGTDDDIVIGDLLSCDNAAKIAHKAATGETAFAIALEAYSTDSPNGVVDAVIIPPRYAP